MGYNFVCGLSTCSSYAVTHSGSPIVNCTLCCGDSLGFPYCQHAPAMLWRLTRVPLLSTCSSYAVVTHSGSPVVNML